MGILFVGRGGLVEVMRQVLGAESWKGMVLHRKRGGEGGGWCANKIVQHYLLRISPLEIKPNQLNETLHKFIVNQLGVCLPCHW